MAFNPQFDGFALTNANSIDVLSFEELRPRRIQTTAAIGSGSVLTAQKRGGMTIKFKLRVFGESPADLESNLDDLMNKLQAPIVAELFVFDSESMTCIPVVGGIEYVSGDQGALAFVNVSFVSTMEAYS